MAVFPQRPIKQMELAELENLCASIRARILEGCEPKWWAFELDTWRSGADCGYALCV